MALAIVIMLLGVIGFVNLPVEQFPDIAPPVVEVSADYTGASADAVQYQWYRWYRLYQFFLHQ